MYLKDHTVKFSSNSEILSKLCLIPFLSLLRNIQKWFLSFLFRCIPQIVSGMNGIRRKMWEALEKEWRTTLNVKHRQGEEGECVTIKTTAQQLREGWSEGEGKGDRYLRLMPSPTLASSLSPIHSMPLLSLITMAVGMKTSYLTYLTGQMCQRARPRFFVAKTRLSIPRN